MFTYTTGKLHAGNLINDTSSTTATILGTLINQATKKLINARDWDFLEKSKTISTVAAQQAYDLPSDLGKLMGVTVTISTTRYTPVEITNRQEWDRINQVVISSDIPEFFYVFNGTIEFYPKPSTSSNTITFIYQRTQRDLSIADYTTGGILTATTGSASIVGTGTTFTKSMEGKFLRIDESETANKGDGNWYEIETYTSATAISLARLYSGTSITAGNASYTIGQVSVLPETYQELPILKAVEIYYSSIKPEPDRAKMYRDLYDAGVQDMIGAESSKTTSVTMSKKGRRENPNWYPSV